MSPAPHSKLGSAQSKNRKKRLEALTHYTTVCKSVEQKLVAGYAVTHDDFENCSHQRIGVVIKMIRENGHDVLELRRGNVYVGWCLASTVLDNQSINPKGN